MVLQNSILAGTLALLLPLCANAFYLPGAAPHDYAAGEQVNLFVNALTPMLAGHDDSKLVRHLKLKDKTVNTNKTSL
jgi:transmembrane 9 superfamily protein 2/4